MSELDSFQRRMVEKAREELAAPVDLTDTHAMIRRTGRLEVALERLLEIIDPEAADGPQSG